MAVLSTLPLIANKQFRKGVSSRMSQVRAGAGFANMAKLSSLIPLLKRIKNLRVFRVLPEMRDCGIVAPGFNVTWQTKSGDLLELIRKLAPQDSGPELIRIGGPGDGGYLIPDDLDGIEYCFSPRSQYDIRLRKRASRSRDQMLPRRLFCRGAGDSSTGVYFRQEIPGLDE